MGMILDDSVIREIEVANNARDSKEEDYHLQIARWLKDYKRLLELESSYNSNKNELKQEPCKGYIYLTKEAYEELCYKASKWNELELCEDTISRANAPKKLKEKLKDGLRTVFDTESYASEDGGDLIRYEDAVGAVEELDFVQPKKTVGKLISIEVLDKIRERVELEKLGYPPSAGYYRAIMKVLQIIDKYNTESEDKEIV